MSQARLYRIESQRLTGEDQVFAALLGLGGAAHVDLIVERVTLERRSRGLKGGPAVRTMVESALHHMRTSDDRPQGGADARVYRPFGASSRRWAVCRDAAPPTATIGHRRPVLAAVGRR